MKKFKNKFEIGEMLFKVGICLVLTYLPLAVFAAQRTVYSSVFPYSVFGPEADLENGIIGTVNPNGRVEVFVYDRTSETLMYRAFITHSTTAWGGEEIVYSKASLGSGAVYYPESWSSRDYRASLFGIERKRCDDASSYPFNLLTNKLDIKIVISEDNGSLTAFKFPGIGIIDNLGGNSMFHPKHYCHDLNHNLDFVTLAWKKLKQPDITKGADLAIACHRGIWGDKLGAGNPENSTPAIEATKSVTDILESDIMLTKDEELVVIHDYNLHRLTNYEGTDRDYLFNMTWNQLSFLRLRRRNMTVSTYGLLKFNDLVDLLVKNQLVLTVDIKDIRAKYNSAGECIDNCEYDPKTHGEAAAKKIKDSWMKILKRCIEIAQAKHALQYVAFKVPHPYSELKSYIHDSILSKVLFMPVIQPLRSDYLDFTDAWITDGGARVVAYETNFKLKNDLYLAPFTRQDVSYENFLHYVYARTGLRPGCYPEEPMGPKGIVNRWADWLSKDLTKDVRGDHYFLMSIPYGKIMILTTDRPDIWRKISDVYNSNPQ